MTTNTRPGLAHRGAAQSPVPLRHQNHLVICARAIARTDVEGEIEGYISLWGNPECVDWKPNIRVSWGEAEKTQYGIVTDVIGDGLVIDVYELYWDWERTEQSITLPKLSVRAVDSYGTWFDKTRPPAMALENGMERRPFMYQHGRDEVIGKSILGTLIEIDLKDDLGIKFRALLDRSNPFFNKVVGEIQRGELFTSSSTAEHTGDFYPDGAMETWILHELSATPTPAEERMPAVSIIRSDAHVERDAPSDQQNEEEPIPAEPPPSVETETAQLEPETSDTSRTDLMDMAQALAAIVAALQAGIAPQDIMNQLVQAGATAEQLQALAAALASSSGQGEQPVPQPETEMSAAGAAPATTPNRSQQANPLAALTSMIRNANQQVAAQQQTQQLIQQAVDAAMRTRMSEAPVQTPTQRTAPTVGANVNFIEERKYSARSADAMWGAASVMAKMGMKPGEAFMRAMAHKTHDMRTRLSQQDEFMSSYMSSFQRADDFMNSEITGQGDEWAGVLYGNRIWAKARNRQIFRELINRGMMEMEVGQGAESANVPLEGSDPIFYTTAQASDIDATGNPEVVVNPGFIGTSSVNVRPGEVTGATAYTDILTEDAVFDVIAQITQQLEVKAGDVIESIIINSDSRTAANTNINMIDGTPGAGLSKPHWLVTNGLLYLPLFTNTALASDGGGVLELQDTFLSLKDLMAREMKADPSRLVYLTDVDTYQTAKGMPQILTSDVAQRYTLETGLLPKIDGTDVLASGQMELANSAGKVPVAGGTLGRVLLLYPEYFALIWKRMVTFEQMRFGLSKTNVIAASFRISVKARGTTGAALKYNVGRSAS